MKKKILITGTSGFIGNALKKYFLNAGYQVFGTTYSKNPENENELSFDITKKDEFSKLWKDEQFKIIIHTVGLVNQTLPYETLYKVNTKGVELMCDYAIQRGCEHFIFTSSSSVYGLKTMGENREESKTKRSTNKLFFPPYGSTKAMAEQIIERSTLKYTILRIPMVLGNGDTFITPSILPRIQNGTVFICGNKNHKFSILYIKNLGPLIEKLIEVGPLNASLNCGSHDVYWNDFVAEYASNLKVKYEPRKKSLLSLLSHRKDKAYQFIATFSAFGAHYMNNSLYTKLGEWLPPYDWKQGVKEAIAGYLCK